MKTIILILAAIATSCAPKAIIVEPIAPKAAATHEAVKAASAGSKRVQVAVTTTHEQARGLAVKADSITAEVDRLRKFPGVPAGEFEALWAMATDLKRDSWAHEIQTREVVRSAAEVEKLNAYAEANSGELAIEAKAVDKGVIDLKIDNSKKTAAANKWDAVSGFGYTVAIFAFLTLLVWGISKLKLRI